jgi:hypothetical protein
MKIKRVPKDAQAPPRARPAPTQQTVGVPWPINDRGHGAEAGSTATDPSENIMPVTIEVV